MKIVRGKNNMAIESDCAWAVPRDTWSNPVIHTATDDEKNDPNNDYTNGDYPQRPEIQ
jgi:cathepsin X